jgi:predicted RNase H-like HicB family nuclease
MKIIDRYHKWVEWSDEDQTYIGKCPDLITGIHGDDPIKLYEEMCQLLQEIITQFARENKPLPPPSVRPMQEVI